MEASDEMMIISAECWQCDKAMLVALMGDDQGNLSCGPEGFSEDDRKLAEAHGVLLKTVSSKTAEETYLANTCKECGAFVGQFYFFAHYYTPALYGHYQYKRIKATR
jgi:hypothetical protein